MKFLSKIFPLPRYLRMPAVGIDISDRNIKCAELKVTKEGLVLKTFGSRNIEAGIVEKGEIKKENDLVEHLKFLKGGLNTEYVVASLPEEKAFLRTCQLPLMEDYQVKGTLETEMEGLVPLLAEESVFDFEIASKSFDKKKIDIVLSVFPKKIAEQYAGVFKKAGLCPVAFEIENQSIFRVAVPKERETATMVIDFGKTRTSFFVGEAGIVKFGSTVKISGESIDLALARRFNLDLTEAEELKKKQIVQKKGNNDVMNSLLPVISIVKNEAVRVLNYWQSYAKEQGLFSEEIKDIVLSGGDANMFGLVDYLSCDLKRPVMLVNPWLNINSLDQYVPEMEHRQSLMYASALGLALRPFIDYD